MHIQTDQRLHYMPNITIYVFIIYLCRIAIPINGINIMHLRAYRQTNGSIARQIFQYNTQPVVLNLPISTKP